MDINSRYNFQKATKRKSIIIDVFCRNGFPNMVQYELRLDDALFNKIRRSIGGANSLDSYFYAKYLYYDADLEMEFSVDPYSTPLELFNYFRPRKKYSYFRDMDIKIVEHKKPINTVVPFIGKQNPRKFKNIPKDYSMTVKNIYSEIQNAKSKPFWSRMLWRIFEYPSIVEKTTGVKQDFKNGPEKCLKLY